MKSFERFLRERVLVGRGEFRAIYNQRLRTGKPIVEILLSSGRLTYNQLRQFIIDYLSEIEREEEEKLAGKIIRRDQIIPPEILTEVTKEAMRRGKSIYHILKDRRLITEEIWRKCLQEIWSEIDKEIAKWGTRPSVLTLLASGDVDAEAQEMLLSFGPPSFFSWLVVRNYVTQEQFAEARNHKQSTGDTICLTLARRGYLTLKEVEDAVRTYGVFGSFVALSFREYRRYFAEPAGTWELLVFPGFTF